MSDFWNLERAFRNAWPAASETQSSAWVLRLSGGTTRRTNSINPITDVGAEPEEAITSVINDASAIQARRSPQEWPLFRIPDFLPEIESDLRGRGFRPASRTKTLLYDLGRLNTLPDREVELAPRATEEWLAARFRIANDDPDQMRAFREMVERIQLPVQFAALSADDQVVSIGYVAVGSGSAIIEAVGTAPEHRRRGYSMDVLRALLKWAQSAGATSACLQVMAENAPAISLYRKLGFDETLYSYAYYGFPE